MLQIQFGGFFGSHDRRNVGCGDFLIRRYKLNGVVKMSVCISRKENPVAIVQMFHTKLSVMSKLIIERHSDVKRIIRNF